MRLRLELTPWEVGEGVPVLLHRGGGGRNAALKHRGAPGSSADDLGDVRALTRKSAPSIVPGEGRTGAEGGHQEALSTLSPLPPRQEAMPKPARAHQFVLVEHQAVVVRHHAEAVPPLLVLLDVLEEVPRVDDVVLQRDLPGGDPR